MSRTPRVTGPTSLRPSEGLAFLFSESKAAITFCATRAPEPRLCPPTQARPSGLACCTRSFGIAK